MTLQARSRIFSTLCLRIAAAKTKAIDAARLAGATLVFFIRAMERAPVRQLIRGFRASAARRQTVACLLLLLIAHALFVHFTHHHAGRGHDLTSAPVASQDTHTPDEHLPQAQSEHCVACHLQRSYLTLEHAPVVALIFTPADAGWESLPFDPHQAGAFLSAAGRAPPLS